MIPVALATERLSTEIALHIDAENTHNRQIMATENLLREYPGHCPIRALIQTPMDVLFTVELGKRWTAHPSQDVIKQLKEIWGHDNVKVSMKQFNFSDVPDMAYAK